MVIYDYLDNPLYVFNAKGETAPPVDRSILERSRVEEEIYFKVKGREAIAFHHTDSRNRIVIVVAAYDEDGWARLVQLRHILFLGLLIGIAIALIGGYVFSVQLVRPLSTIIQK